MIKVFKKPKIEPKPSTIKLSPSPKVLYPATIKPKRASNSKNKNEKIPPKIDQIQFTSPRFKIDYKIPSP